MHESSKVPPQTWGKAGKTPAKAGNVGSNPATCSIGDWLNGRALGSGPRDHWFDSSIPDHFGPMV